MNYTFSVEFGCGKKVHFNNLNATHLTIFNILSQGLRVFKYNLKLR